MRNLSFEEIKSITWGAVDICEKDGIRFSRFTEEQVEMYKRRKPDDKQIYTSAGIKLAFKTNSKNLLVKLCTFKASWKNFFSFDLLIDGKYAGSLDNLTDSDENDYLDKEYMLGQCEKTFDLGKGEKSVELVFPWSVEPVLEKIAIDENSFVEGISSEKKMLVFGDSITIGELALRPYKRYPSQLSRFLNVEEICKAIGGESFVPDLANLPEKEKIDLITVAYGTNDWAWGKKETFEADLYDFVNNLTKHYPDLPIFVITPIWRADYITKGGFCDFYDLINLYKQKLKCFDNVRIISGYDLVPKESKYFADSRLHPNNAGFDEYFKSIKNNYII